MEEQVDLTLEREKQAKPLAVEILQFLVSLENLGAGIGDIKLEDKFTFWNKAMNNFIVTLRNRNLKQEVIAHAFLLTKEAVDQFKDVVNVTFDEKVNYVEEKMWGKPFRELSLDDIESKEAPYRLEDYNKFVKSSENVDNSNDIAQK